MLICAVVRYAPALATDHVFSIHGEQTRLNGRAFLVSGLRCSNALISDTETQELIDHLDEFASHGVNTVSLYVATKVPDKPYIQSEATPQNAPGGDWGKYSKRSDVYNYFNNGLYTEAVKADQKKQTAEHLSRGDGYGAYQPAVRNR
jgi:hypothetical protein